MKQALDKLLCEKYPKIMVNRNKDMKETTMCWGFECGDGWFNILDQLMGNIQHHIDWRNKKEEFIAQVTLDQVKEKFGTLSFYYTGGDDYIRGMVRMAESMSGTVCEECGAPGKLRGSGWIYTACDTHTKPEHLTEQEQV